MQQSPDIYSSASLSGSCAEDRQPSVVKGLGVEEVEVWFSRRGVVCMGNVSNAGCPASALREPHRAVNGPHTGRSFSYPVCGAGPAPQLALGLLAQCVFRLWVKTW